MLPVRLKTARLHARLTQEKLGVLAGIEEETARFAYLSTRVGYIARLLK